MFSLYEVSLADEDIDFRGNIYVIADSIEVVGQLIDGYLKENRFHVKSILLKASEAKYSETLFIQQSKS